MTPNTASHTFANIHGNQMDVYASISTTGCTKDTKNNQTNKHNDDTNEQKRTVSKKVTTSAILVAR